MSELALFYRSDRNLNKYLTHSVRSMDKVDSCAVGVRDDTLLMDIRHKTGINGNRTDTSKT